MRIPVTAGCIVVVWICTACPAREPPSTNRKVEHAGPPVRAVLRDASEIALKQDEHQQYWSERVLLCIGAVQIRAGDFDGALRSIRGSGYEYGRDAGLVKLAEALARDGKWEPALDALRVLGSDHGWQQDYLDDGVRLRWIEHLTAAGDLARAG